MCRIAQPIILVVIIHYLRLTNTLKEVEMKVDPAQGPLWPEMIQLLGPPLGVN